MSVELWGLFASSFIASTILPGGSEVALAWLVNQGEIPLHLLLIAAITGNSLGGILTLLCGVVIAKYYPAKQLQKPYQIKAMGWIQNRGSIALLLSWLPLIGDPLCLIAGWLRLNIMHCVLFIILGKAVRYILIATVFLPPAT
jgi:membrane protein YqaA with SNARE-associated domain